jgi:hypothetical protein
LRSFFFVLLGNSVIEDRGDEKSEEIEILKFL